MKRHQRGPAGCAVRLSCVALVSLLFFCAEPYALELAGDEVRDVPRLALVVGNSSYSSSPLDNPVNDATDMAAALTELGFEVTAKLDSSREDTARAIQQFGRTLRERRGVGLFYYAGHGMQVNGRNYLIPVDAQVGEEYEVEFEGIDAGRVLQAMEAAANPLNIVILDACRNNPFARSFRSTQSGLAQMDAPSGSYIAYATSPGGVAVDGRGWNGIYTKHLLQAIRTPGATIEQVMKTVRIAVELETAGKQTPWEASSLKGDFYFLAKAEPADTVTAPEEEEPAGQLQAEMLFWETIKDAGRSDLFATYLEQYPAGLYAAIARTQIEQLQTDRRLAAGAEATSPVSAALTVRSNVYDDTVYIDDRRYGPTRLDVGLPPGTYSLRVEKDGYQPFEKEIKLASAQSSTVMATLYRIGGPRTVGAMRDRLSDGSSAPEMVSIPGGRYTMGSQSTEPGRGGDERQHEVEVAGFSIGKYEVTFAEYDRFARATDRHRAHDAPWGRGRQPVVNVTWSDANAYAQWLSSETGKRYRLPTEAEWEYAARAGSAAAYPWGSTINRSQASCKDCGGRSNRSGSVVVGSFAPNAWGLHDTAGNVWEWICSRYTPSYDGSERVCVSSGNSGQRGLRGGSWTSSTSKIRSAERDRGWPRDRSNDRGFRIVRER